MTVDGGVFGGAFSSRALSGGIIARDGAQTVICNERSNLTWLKGLKGEVLRMADRHRVIGYALEAVARPGARESRTRRPPDGMRIRNERGERYAELGQE